MENEKNRLLDREREDIVIEEIKTVGLILRLSPSDIESLSDYIFRNDIQIVYQTSSKGSEFLKIVKV